MTATITVQGGLTNPPELKFSNNGAPFATFTVASSKRVQNRDTGQWEDGRDKLFLRCTAWGPLAENIIASNLAKGARVTVAGDLLTREWEQDGSRRSQVELKVTDLAVSVKHATVAVSRAPQGGPGAGSGAPTSPNPSGGGFGAQAGGWDDEQPF